MTSILDLLYPILLFLLKRSYKDSFPLENVTIFNDFRILVYMAEPMALLQEEGAQCELILSKSGIRRFSSRNFVTF